MKFLGFRPTTDILNFHRNEDGERPPVSRYAVMSCVYRMSPRIYKVRKVVGANPDNKNWVDARKKQAEPFSVMCKTLKQEFFLKEGDKLNNLPDYYKSSKLPNIEGCYNVVWFDEVHIAQQTGPPVDSQSYVYQFPRNKEGDIDIKNGTFAPKLFKPTFKYPKECRMCAGVAKIKTQISQDGSTWVDKGLRLPLFNYSEKSWLPKNI